MQWLLLASGDLVLLGFDAFTSLRRTCVKFGTGTPSTEKPLKTTTLEQEAGSSDVQGPRESAPWPSSQDSSSEPQ
eukprot:CAMPEP_0172701284 /NCGR_PEP_ID=MMETSP1074-20121228/31526_1 /TAXON_ID=2916 /ORGANISM="Ceratium fusus, Strain PA161109" /LENGTH=74 /DNA_ID=CAMNT_0013522805 /DNA_START=480 /DNA_END=705 /DNA_ORIENTATION=+